MKKLFIILIVALAGCQTTSKKPAEPKPDTTVITTPKPAPADLQNPWVFIQNESQINIPLNQRIIAERDNFIKYKISFERTAMRSEPYMYFIVNSLHQRNMPIELALLPLLESAYNPLATSSAKAAGLWQIVPITASAYGMSKNQWFDPRRDLIESTNTALNLLEYLNKSFDGDWLLTLAAYNAGEGRVRRAIAWNKSKGLPTHYWALNLPKETMQYVPKMLALIDIVKHCGNYGITLPELDYSNALVKVDIGEKIKLERVSQFTDLTMEELKTYNAGYSKQILNGPFHLLVPSSYAELLYERLVSENYSQAEIIDLISATQQAELNDAYAITSTNLKYKSITDIDLQTYAQQHRRNSQIVYQVKPGDNLSMIAKNHHVKVSEILKWNNLKNADRLRPGDKLTINVRNGSSS
ncbi:transglycosylase SLT domain-containing protein [Zophobihabitans entericus]|uniref:Transglycosylase SLT domain-containing protein n=1 Tax=Zophobihabitans entericus TaxID=1635327 RepID=A0A6G9IC50_9GAMM|nr:transglycosylase SLT domain-containing protein [Zophobihabitans entericus]QIQ21805.1 transglycosylase SLT domain-containing protein [Zophobihabitans entericus]